MRGLPPREPLPLGLCGVYNARIRKRHHPPRSSPDSLARLSGMENGEQAPLSQAVRRFKRLQICQRIGAGEGCDGAVLEKVLVVGHQTIGTGALRRRHDKVVLIVLVQAALFASHPHVRLIARYRSCNLIHDRKATPGHLARRLRSHFRRLIPELPRRTRLLPAAL